METAEPHVHFLERESVPLYLSLAASLWQPMQGAITLLQVQLVISDSDWHRISNQENPKFQWRKDLYIPSRQQKLPVQPPVNSRQPSWPSQATRVVSLVLACSQVQYQSWRVFFVGSSSITWYRPWDLNSLCMCILCFLFSHSSMVSTFFVFYINLWSYRVLHWANNCMYLVFLLPEQTWAWSRYRLYFFFLSWQTIPSVRDSYEIHETLKGLWPSLSDCNGSPVGWSPLFALDYWLSPSATAVCLLGLFSFATQL